MAIQIGKRKVSDEPEVMMEINTTPLIDVMLVLLVMLIITIPVVTTAIPVKLPKERIEARERRRKTSLFR